MRSVTVYEYDHQLRPRTIGVDFESDRKDDEFTLRYEEDEAERLGREVVKWILEVTE